MYGVSPTLFSYLYGLTRVCYVPTTYFYQLLSMFDVLGVIRVFCVVSRVSEMSPIYMWAEYSNCNVASDWPKVWADLQRQI